MFLPRILNPRSFGSSNAFFAEMRMKMRRIRKCFDRNHMGAYVGLTPRREDRGKGDPKASS